MCRKFLRNRSERGVNMSEKEQVRTVEEEKKVEEILSAGETPSDPPKRGRGRPRKYPDGSRMVSKERIDRTNDVAGQITETIGELDSAKQSLRSYMKADYIAKETSKEETAARIKEEKSVVAKLIAKALTLAEMKPIDLSDPAQFQKRIEDYFVMMANSDTKPTVAGLALLLNGMTRQQLYRIVYKDGFKDALPEETVRIIRAAYATMEELWEGYMLHGQINPVSGIFLGKNHYGYQDKSEVAVTHEKVESAPKLDKIAERYALPVESIEVINSDESKVE